MKRFGLTCVMLATLGITAAALAQETPKTYSIKRVVKAGDVLSVAGKAEIEVGGVQITFTLDSISTVAEVKDDGSYAVKSKTANLKVIVNGEEHAQPDREGDEKMIFAPTGELLAIEAATPNPLSFRLTNLGIVHQPDAPVKIGDSWEYKIASDSTKGAVAATCEYKVIGEEKFDNVVTLKLETSVTETEGDSPASVKGIVWLDLKDFSKYKSETTWTNVPLPGLGIANGKVSSIRK